MGNYFVRVEDATELRRKVLESSKASINVLRGYQRLSQIRSEKATMLKALRRDLKDLTMLVNRMEEMLPALSQAEVEELNPAPQELPEVKGAAKKQAAKPKPAPKPAARKIEMPMSGERKVYLGKHDVPAVRPPAPVPAPRMQAPLAQPAAHAAPEPPRQKSELEKLHDKLAEIEGKLGKL